MKREYRGDRLKDEISSFIREQKMFSRGETVLLAVSGGPDSMALLSMLSDLSRNLGISLGAAHLHHGLRGVDADRDLALVRKQCRILGIPLHVRRVDVAAFARREKLSIETAAREARYLFLLECARKTGAVAIALGHTADDQVETFAMNLLRGAGGRGLRAMQPVRHEGDVRIARPFLRTWRAELLLWTKANRVPYRIDRTNFDLSFLRNRVRHRLIPYLARNYNPKLKEAFLKSAEISGSQQELIEEQAAKIFRSAAVMRGQSVALPAGRFLSVPLALKGELLRLALERLRYKSALSYGDVLAVERLCRGGTGFASYPLGGGMTVSREYGRIVMGRVRAGGKLSYELPLKKVTGLELPDLRLRFMLSEYTGGRLRRIKKRPAPLAEIWRDEEGRFFPLVERVSLDAIGSRRLKLRNRRPGDRYRPLGGPGSRKIKEIMIDEKLPAPLRSIVPLVVCGSEIVWLVGYRISEAYRVTSSTRRVLEFVVEKMK